MVTLHSNGNPKKSVELFPISPERQQSLLFTSPSDASGCFHSTFREANLCISSIIGGFSLSNKNTYDGHAIPLFFEIASSEVCLIIQRVASRVRPVCFASAHWYTPKSDAGCCGVVVSGRAYTFQ